MKKFVFIIIFISQLSFGQLDGKSDSVEIDTILENKMEKIDSDSKGFTRITCTAFSSVNSTAYLFWKDKSTIMMQKIEFDKYPKPKLSSYQPVVVEDDFFFNNFEKIQVELQSENEIKLHRTHMTTVDKKNQSVSTGFSMVSHSCYRRIAVLNKDKTFDKGFDYYNLRKHGSRPESKSNINYDFNQNLQITKWDNVIIKHIEEIERVSDFILINNN